MPVSAANWFDHEMIKRSSSAVARRRAPATPFGRVKTPSSYRRSPSSGPAATLRTSAQQPAKRAAVAASPVMPGRSGATGAAAATSAGSAYDATGVIVAWKSSGDWNSTPMTVSRSSTVQNRPG